MSATTEVYAKLEQLIPTLDGWCTPQRAIEIASFIIATKPQTSCLVGVWGGRDTFAAALAHKFNGKGKVLAIDPWKAKDSVVGQTGVDAEWWAKQDIHDLVYGRFIASMHSLGLNDYIDVRRQRSDEVEAPIAIGFLAIDGNHGDQAIHDVHRYAPKVVAGGVVYADDIGWSGGSVAKAVQDLMQLGFRHLYDRDTGAFFQRIR
jgi:hypothetical protein